MYVNPGLLTLVQGEPYSEEPSLLGALNVRVCVGFLRLLKDLTGTQILGNKSQGSACNI